MRHCGMHYSIIHRFTINTSIQAKYTPYNKLNTTKVTVALKKFNEQAWQYDLKLRNHIKKYQ